MKFCTKCGAEICDEAVICPKCGCSCETETKLAVQESESSTLKLVAKIFMILSCVSVAWTLIPLCWMIPMTVHYHKAAKENRPVGIGFKICTLLFVNLLSGILMLCDKD